MPWGNLDSYKTQSSPILFDLKSTATHPAVGGWVRPKPLAGNNAGGVIGATSAAVCLADGCDGEGAALSPKGPSILEVGKGGGGHRRHQINPASDLQERASSHGCFPNGIPRPQPDAIDEARSNSLFRNCLCESEAAQSQ